MCDTRYTAPPATLFTHNRKRLRELLPAGAMVVVYANDQLPTNADGLMPFRQNSNFYYLCGVDQEESILLLFADASSVELREVLFLRSTTDEVAIWEGRKLSKEAATTLSGIENIQPLEAFEKIFYQLVCEAEILYLESNEHYRAHIVVQSRNARFVATCQQKYPLHRYARLAPLLAKLRATKLPEEVEQLRKACHITANGFSSALQMIAPNCREYEIEAVYSQAFISQGSRGFAYAPIIASGANACILHYTTNAATCQSGELLLMDVGAEYGNYNADMTRTVPVSGRFSSRQRAIYDAVLQILRHAKSLLRPGAVISDYQQKVEAVIEEKLCQLGLLSSSEIRREDLKKPARNRYFMHGASHHLGLDVHDVPFMYEPLQAGAVLTVEPGIYVQEEGIGIRLENNVLITENGVEDLMADIPLEAEEIEDLMQK